MPVRTLNDIFRCPYCKSIAARSDIHCRGCGVKFSGKYMEIMQNSIRSPIGAIPWNTRDRYRCVHCDRFVAISDHYCRGCGDNMEDYERQLMQLRLSELAKQNTSALIGLGVFILLVIFISIPLVK